MTEKYDPALFALAHQRMLAAPGDLTAGDFDQLKIVSQGLFDQAHQLRQFAQREMLTKSVDSPSQTKAAPTVKVPTSLKEFVNKDGSRTVTYRRLDQCIDVIFEELKELRDTERTRVASLEARVKELESRPALKYAGIFQAGENYSEGRLVTHAGSLWLAEKTTSGTPGSAGSGFRLIVKRGEA